MTGQQLAQRHGATVVIGRVLKYDWPSRTVMLPPAVAFGTSAYALACAAHETAHYQQPQWWHWLRIVDIGGFPFRNCIETDAWRRAVAILAAL